MNMSLYRAEGKHFSIRRGRLKRKIEEEERKEKSGESKKRE